jgi:hypothetical protein
MKLLCLTQRRTIVRKMGRMGRNRSGKGGRW